MIEKNKCIVIENSDLDGDINRLYRTIIANPDKFFLLSTDLDLPLFKMFDKIAKNVEDTSELTSARIAYEIDFDLETQLIIGESDNSQTVAKLSDLLELLEYNDDMMLARDDYHVVIDDSKVDKNVPNDQNIASKSVSKLFQQAIFLHLDLDIKCKSEISKALIKERFRQNYQVLRAQIDKQKNFLSEKMDRGELGEFSAPRVKNMLESFDKMIEEFEKARYRPIRIAAMGTKKAGKSVVINSILKKDYAPTSSQLPTPNTIRYIPVDKDSMLVLEYKGKQMTFVDAKNLRDYIGKEFEEAQSKTGEGSGLEDMVIYYPSDELTGFEIWDTPGPNFAGAGEEHHKIAEECIRNADICIFVMNYSNHLTDDEVEFLQKIRDYFELNDKFYSLFITVNRIDEIYASEDEKSVNRAIDYIRGRLEDLNYKNITMFATSALQSFYLDAVLKQIEEDGIELDEKDGKPLLNNSILGKLGKNHSDQISKTRRIFLKNAINNLEEFLGIEEPTVDVLDAFSGIPQLKRHALYIGYEKVDSEIINSVISKCEMQFAMIKNSFQISELMRLSEEDRARLGELKAIVSRLRDHVSKIVRDISSPTDRDIEKKIRKEIQASVENLKSQALRDAPARYRAAVNNGTVTESDLEQLSRGIRTENIKKIFKNVSDSVIAINNRSAESSVKMIGDIGGNIAAMVEGKIQRAQVQIQDAIENAKRESEVDGSTIVSEFIKQFEVPQFPTSLSQVSYISKNLTEGTNIDGLKKLAATSTGVRQESRTRIVTRKRESRGILEDIQSFFGRQFYEDVEENYSVAVEFKSPAKFKENILKKLESDIERDIEASHRQMENEIQDEVDKIISDIDQQCRDIGDSYSSLFSSFADDIDIVMGETSKHEEMLNADIALFEEIRKNLEPFFADWYNILGKKVGA